MKDTTEVLCPYCHTEMLKGYLKTTDLNWIRNTSDFTFWRYIVKKNGGQPLNMRWTRFPVYITAYRCETCKKIIFSYDE